MFFLDLSLIDGALLTKAVGKPLCRIPVQRPGQCFDVFGIVGGNTTIDSHRILQRLINCVLLLVHQKFRRDRMEQSQQFSFAHIAVLVWALLQNPRMSQQLAQILL